MKVQSNWPRILVAIAALLLTGALFFPIWQIELSAPQYPEGLVLKIYANALAGDVDVINGLNHYIGMKTLHSNDFIEFTLLPYIIGALVLLGLVAAALNRKTFYYTYIFLFVVFGIVSMVDFYRWNYNYGHNLDPHAAIRVPGMAYQPPLIGYKQLLNFGAYSIPDTGGWLFIASGVLLVITFLLLLQPKWLPSKKRKIATALLVGVFLQSCSATPQPIKYGSDACDHCKMIIMDKKFAAEWVTDKAKVYRFDDVHCLVSFTAANKGKGTAYVNEYNGQKELLKAEDLFYVRSENIKSPMGGNVAAFAQKVEMEKTAKSMNGTPLSWSDLQQQLK